MFVRSQQIVDLVDTDGTPGGQSVGAHDCPPLVGEVVEPPGVGIEFCRNAPLKRSRNVSGQTRAGLMNVERAEEATQRRVFPGQGMPATGVGARGGRSDQRTAG